MKCIRKGEGRFDMALEEGEWLALKDLVTQYPKTPSDHHSLTSEDNPDPDLKDSDEWLKENGAVHQGERHRQIKAWIKTIHPFKQEGVTTYTIEFEPEKADWLIEILNDIRVGCWLSLGCPSPEDLTGADWKKEDWPTLWSMELSGMYQSVLLKCLE